MLFKLSEVSASIYVFELSNVARNQLLGCSERRFQARFAPPDVKYAFKSTSRIINFETLDPRRSPRCPQESPEIDMHFCSRFLGSILRSFSIPESIKFQDNLKSLKS